MKIKYNSSFYFTSVNYKYRSRNFTRKAFKAHKIIFIIKGFRTIVFIFIVISTTFRPICPPKKVLVELETLLNPRVGGSPILIPLAITRYKC